MAELPGGVGLSELPDQGSRIKHAERRSQSISQVSLASSSVRAQGNEVLAPSRRSSHKAKTTERTRTNTSAPPATMSAKMNISPKKFSDSTIGSSNAAGARTSSSRSSPTPKTERQFPTPPPPYRCLPSPTSQREDRYSLRDDLDANSDFLAPNQSAPPTAIPPYSPFSVRSTNNTEQVIRLRISTHNTTNPTTNTPSEAYLHGLKPKDLLGPHPVPPVLRAISPRWSRLPNRSPLPGVHVPCPRVGSVETVVFCRGTRRKWLIAGYYDGRAETVCEVHGKVEKLTVAAYLVRMGTLQDGENWVVRRVSEGLMVLSALEGRGSVRDRLE
ncbi:hypothetical protein LTS18_009635 [Coniosporium uncinatum]|uniref:Uncharacterized protein n=1 Tax=Coniosporium uncinatum TaxID=93489 RepID=A0ACC3D9Z0_9PEZI|nr:hypothetical protein LTS18_009635 [Coniosporium uncinatum]